MFSGIALAALLCAQPTPEPPPVDPKVRLADLDQRRVEMHMGLRGYGRFLDAPPAVGASMQLGLGVRLVRGLYLTGEVGVGAHGPALGAAGQAFLGLRHELRMWSWVRPSISLGYTHLFDASFYDEANLDTGCGCGSPGHDGHHGFEVGGGVSAELASRGGAQAGIGLRFPFRKAPRLSLYLRGDASYYFDELPGRLQGGGSLGLQLVF